MSSREEAEDFLSPMPRLTHDPLLLSGVAEAADLLLAAADRGDKICIYGDYDVDGVTSAALMLSVLKKLTDKTDCYIPSRFKEGYGLNMEAVRLIAERGTRLLISVDCGSTNAEEVALAKELGMEVIVTDHHNMAEGKAPDCIIVNPKKEGSAYPFKGLSGCGTAFKLAQAIQRKLAERGDTRFDRADLSQLLDLVALSTIADVVPLLDENRSLVKYGLKALNARQRPGIRLLTEALELGGKLLDAESVSYILAPNINSPGRMDSAAPAVQLLSAQSPSGQLRSLALSMVDSNRLRKSAQETAKARCMEIMQQEDCGDLFTVINAPGIHEGVAGIVAGFLKEMLCRPVCILTPVEGGLLKGTGRSVPGVDLHRMLSLCGDIFIRCGGHGGACGFLMKEEYLPLLRERGERLMEEALEKAPDILEEQIRIEKVLDAEEKTLEFAESLKLLEPYGEGNPRPLFAVTGAEVQNLSSMGSEGRHLRFSACCPDGTTLSCVLFGRAEKFLPLLESGLKIDAVGELGINRFCGVRKVQMNVRDIKRSIFNGQT